MNSESQTSESQTTEVGESLLERTEINGLPVVLQLKPGDEVPEGYVQVNRKWRRTRAAQIKRAARRNRHLCPEGSRPTKVMRAR